jgi:hypothetical protein
MYTGIKDFLTASDIFADSIFPAWAGSQRGTWAGPAATDPGARPSDRGILDALERGLLGFPGDLLEKYVLGRATPPDRHNQRRSRDPKAG